MTWINRILLEIGEAGQLKEYKHIVNWKLFFHGLELQAYQLFLI